MATPNLHLTLKFLGQVDEVSLDALAAALRGAAAGVAPFEAAVTGLGAFPGAARPRVLWAGVGAGASAMVELAGRVDAALAALGVPAEPRAFSPHITLGRLRIPRRAPRLADLLATAAREEFGRVRVERLALMESRLSPHGSRYVERASAELG